MASAMSIRHFILGLLTRQPMSGYDIKCFLKSLSWLIDSPSFGSLYPALHALLEDGLATVEVVPRPDKPSRKIYSITETGRQVLREWVEQPVASGASLKTFLMRLILASNLSHAGLLTHLQQRRAQVAAHQLALEQAAKAIDERTDLGERLALDYGLAVATVELAWLDRTLTQLSQLTSSVEATQGNSATVTV
ncbi:MAG: PadR family transcriptional regulator [Anaerolineae bacterium]